MIEGEPDSMRLQTDQVFKLPRGRTPSDWPACHRLLARHQTAVAPWVCQHPRTGYSCTFPSDGPANLFAAPSPVRLHPDDRGSQDARIKPRRVPCRVVHCCTERECLLPVDGLRVSGVWSRAHRLHRSAEDADGPAGQCASSDWLPGGTAGSSGWPIAEALHRSDSSN